MCRSLVQTSNSNVYDSAGWLHTSTTVTGMQTTYAYDYAQHTVSATSASNFWWPSTPSHWQRTTTDGFGRTIRTEAGVDSNTILSIVDTRYAPCACSPLGKMSKISQPYVSPATPVWTTYTYDASGRTLTVTAPDGASITHYAYQGNQTTITDPAGNAKTYTYDASGNLLQVMEPGSLVTLYTYDVLNHLTHVSMTRGSTTQTRTFTYDSSTQRLTQTTTPEAGTVQYSYNPDGTLLSKTDAMAQQTQYTYDALARVTQVSYLPNGSEDLCQRVYYWYDGGYPSDSPFYGLAYNNPIGRLTGTSWSGGPGCTYGFQEQYAYDAQARVWGRALTMTDPGNGVKPITLTSYFNYDAEGRLTVSQYPAATSGSPNATTTYTTEHDAMGRQSDLYVGSPLQYYLVPPSTVTYNAAGQLTAMSTGAYSETLQYNANLQLTRLTATPTGGQGIDFTYTYPTANNGRISQMTDNVTNEQVSYTYDQLNRLVQSASSVTGTMPFAYDGFGNLTQQGQTTLSIDPSTNRINSANYTYNANGNVTQTPGSPPPTYTYDVADRLVSNNAIYNPRNQRVFDGTNIYLYTPDGKLAGKYTPVWGQSASNAFIQGGQPNVYFAGKLIQESGQWVMTDRLGSVRLNGSGGRSSYQPYGAEVSPTTSDQRTKFATYYRDSAGLDYAGQRYYSNVTGRFLTPDPGGIKTANTSDPTSWNRYAYVGGDPINFGDRHGLFRNIVGNCDALVNGQPQDGCDGDGEPIGNSASGVCGYWEVGFTETSCPSYVPPSLPVGSPANLPRRLPTALNVVVDCWYPDGGLTGNYERVMTYQVVDSANRPFFGSDIATLVGTVSETVTTTFGKPPSAGGVWKPSNNSLTSTGQFTDYLSNTKGLTLAVQSFSANVPGYGVVPLSINFAGVTWPALSNLYYGGSLNVNGTMSTGIVLMNGTISPRPCGASDPPK